MTQTNIPSEMPKPKPAPISAEFPYESRHVDVLGSSMHFVEVGEGKPILFVHGNPTSSYLWRNVLPFVGNRGRAIAVDLIGMGRSDKPNLDYTFDDHSRYLEGFIETLGLEDVTLVVHDWGSALGLHYASRHEANVRGVAFMEALIPPAMPMPNLEAMGPYAEVFRALRGPEGEAMVLDGNFFVERILPGSVLRDLGPEEMTFYRAPFLERESRKPTLVWPRQIPIGGEPSGTTEVVNAYGRWLTRTEIPKLHIYASPGAINPPEVAAWAADNFPNTETAYVGPGLHFLQEDHPEGIGRALDDWIRRNVPA